MTLIPRVDGRAVEIGHGRFHGMADTRSRVAIRDELVTAEAVAPLDDLAAGGRTLAATAAQLIDEIAQAFGIPELGQLSRDGKLRSRYWGNTWSQQIVAWAQQQGIEVTGTVATGIGESRGGAARSGACLVALSASCTTSVHGDTRAP